MALEISSRYQNILRSGEFQSLASSGPWPHFVLDDLLPAADFRRVQARLLRRQIKFEIAFEHPAKLQLCYMEDLELAEFFFSEPLKDLLEGVAQSRLQPNAELAIQFRRMTPESPDFAPHVDLIDKPSLVALYYVAPDWQATSGGELVLLESETSDFQSPKTKWVAPIQNRLLLFMSNDTHWHAVRKVNGWRRLMILTEWFKCA